MRSHNSRYTAGKIIEFYNRDISRLEALNAQGKLNRAELQELERCRKAKELVSRVSSTLQADRKTIF